MEEEKRRDERREMKDEMKDAGYQIDRANLGKE